MRPKTKPAPFVWRDDKLYPQQGALEFHAASYGHAGKYIPANEGAYAQIVAARAAGWSGWAVKMVGDGKGSTRYSPSYLDHTAAVKNAERWAKRRFRVLVQTAPPCDCAKLGFKCIGHGPADSRTAPGIAWVNPEPFA